MTHAGKPVISAQDLLQQPVILHPKKETEVYSLSWELLLSAVSHRFGKTIVVSLRVNCFKESCGVNQTFTDLSSQEQICSFQGHIKGEAFMTEP